MAGAGKLENIFMIKKMENSLKWNGEKKKRKKRLKTIAWKKEGKREKKTQYVGNKAKKKGKRVSERVKIIYREWRKKKREKVKRICIE